MANDVRFPVLRSIEVRNYPMYPGTEDGSGFAVDLLPGVSVIVGINGIGKTTLLNLVLWMLTGPQQPAKADLMRPGSGRHKRVKVSSFDYFATRVGDSIAKAEATLEIMFGDEDRVRVTRSLSNLKIKALWHNRTELTQADEERYLDLVRELSGTHSDWDYDFLVRHLVFFLEEKAPLLWSEEGQFELLRILFLDQDLSEKCVALSDEIAKLDSRVRNKDWQLTDTRDALRELEEAAVGAEPSEDTLPILEAHLDGVQQNLLSYEEREASERQRLENLEKEAFEVEQRLDEKRLQLRHVEQQYFRQAFPNLPTTTELTFGRLLAGDGCLVCGSESTGARDRLLRLQQSNACPVCETPQLAKDDAATPPVVISKARLSKIEKEMITLTKESEKTQGLVDEVRNSLQQLKGEQRDLWKEQVRLESAVADLRAQMPAEGGRVKALRVQLDAAESALKDERNQVEAKRKQFNRLLAKARDRIADVAKQICNEFGRCANTFLEEDCRLEYEMNKRRIGQTGTLMEFPSFVLKMASATATTPRTRGTASQVSESQKEFLDLAFRMAVMRTAVDRGSPCMLVIETPEASLDSFFVERAGRMLRDFTYEGAKIRHTVLASSNLNRENMISELLGLKRTDRKATPKAEITRRIINLLDIAAKPKALVRHLKLYREQLKRALDGA